jgi:hypothetical protein
MHAVLIAARLDTDKSQAAALVIATTIPANGDTVVGRPTISGARGRTSESEVPSRISYFCA